MSISNRSGGAKPRRTFTEAFKREAAQLAIDRGNVSEVARELGIGDSALHRWKVALEREGQGQLKRAFPGRGNPQDEELAKLKRELAHVKMENEILKKAVGIFSKESQ